jgi:oligopeptide/dipeptide ABC transporter ATP-binding protein
LLEVRDLHTEFRTEDAVVRAVDGVSFVVRRGEVVGLVGESGCGKSVTSLSIMGLLPAPYGRIVSGEVRFDGVDLTRLSPAEMRKRRGRSVAMIFQDPMTSLNPYLRLEEQLAEVGMLHLGLSRREATLRAVALLDRVGIADAKERIRSYPHELSGGMRQRAMIAMALLCDPSLLIADEPTTALDVTIQAQILELLLELCRERGLAVILITHDLGVVAETADRVLVMYAGRIVEEAPARALFKEPWHPYTLGLLRSVPRAEARPTGRLASIEGMPPRLDRGPFTACTFAPRCPFVHDACLEREPPLEEVTGSFAGAALRADCPTGRLKRCVLAPERVR